MDNKARRVPAIVLLVLAVLAGCGGPEAKKRKFLERGKEYQAKGDFVRAGLEFKNAIQIDPKFAEAHYRLGLANMSRGNLGGAYGSLIKAVDLDPTLLPAQVQLGRLLLWGGEAGKAMEYAERVLRQAPDDPDGLLLKGAVFVAGKENAAARAHLERVLAKGIDRPDAHLLLARTFAQEKDAKSAEAALLRGLKNNGKDLSLHRALADLYNAGGRYEAAAEQVKEVIALEPENYGNPITLAGLYWNTGRESEGRRILRDLLAAAPSDEGRRLDTARFFLSRGAAADAERALREGIVLNVRTFRLRFALADLYKNTGKSEQSVAVLKECLTLEKDKQNPDILTTLNALARVHLLRREVEQAKGVADDIVKASPGNVDGHLVRGNLNLLSGDGAGAVSEFRTVVNDRPQFVPGYLFLAEGHLLKKEVNLAGEALQNALKVDPKSRDVRRALGRFHALRKEFPKSEEYLRGILEGDPSDLEVRADLGDVLAAAKEPGKAEGQYAEIMRRAPKLALGYVKMAEHYRGHGKRDRAGAEYERAVAAEPGNLTLYLILGRLRIEEKQYAKAAKAYEEALSRRPDFWIAANDLAALLCEHPGTGKELDRALALAESARKIRPDDPIVQDTLGWACYKKGDNAKALDLLGKAQGSLPEHPEVNYHLGMALVKDGKRERANAHFRKSVAAKGEFPGKAEAARALAGR